MRSKRWRVQESELERHREWERIQANTVLPFWLRKRIHIKPTMHHCTAFLLIPILIYLFLFFFFCFIFFCFTQRAFLIDSLLLAISGSFSFFMSSLIVACRISGVCTQYSTFRVYILRKSNGKWWYGYFGFIHSFI